MIVPITEKTPAASGSGVLEAEKRSGRAGWLRWPIPFPCDLPPRLVPAPPARLPPRLTRHFPECLVIEPGKFATCFAYPHFARNGVRVSISADVPSSPQNMQAPLYVVACATTLLDLSDPDSTPFPPGLEALTVEQAIRAVTIDAAWQLRMEDKVGSLKAGKYADIVVLDTNPFEVEPRAIADITVLGTMMNGRFTHREGI
jgi:hypothetical protein